MVHGPINIPKQNFTSKHIPDVCVAFSEKITGDGASCSRPCQRENPVIVEIKPGRRVSDTKIKTHKENSGATPSPFSSTGVANRQTVASLKKR
jgi:hypothetical protein